MKLSVMIPTYRRGESLSRCLNGLAMQARPADQVVVITRPDDEESRRVMTEWSGMLPITPVSIDRPGVVQAMNRGLEFVSGDVVCCTDDDAVPHPDWLQKIEHYFAADAQLGGVGGRDVVHEYGGVVPAGAAVVGVIQPLGRIVGNHHIGVGEEREVDLLKGVNMSWRMAAVGSSRFDEDLRGQGAQVYFEIGFSLKIKRKGWRIVYDPRVLVDHFPAQRFDSDQRRAPSEEATENAAYNYYLMLRRYLARRRFAALIWASLIGTPGIPGVVRGWTYAIKKNRDGMRMRELTARAWRDAKTAAGN